MGKWVHRLLSIDIVNKRGICSNCGDIGIRLKDGIWRCRVGVNKWALSSIGFGYKIGICEICNKKTSKLVQDHNHSNMQLRGWVCSRCNNIISIIENNKEHADYLEKYDNIKEKKLLIR